MIQRLQTVLLFFAALVNMTVLFAPFWYFANNNMHNPEEKTAILKGRQIEVQVMSMETGDWTTEVQSMGEHPLVLGHVILVIVTSLALLGNIFLFKNRPRQLQFTYITLVLVLVQTMMMILQSQKLGQLTGEVSEGSFDEGPSWGYAIPLLAILLVWWATRRIRKDEKLVKSMDRLR